VAYLGGDWLRVRRAENLVRLFEGARRRLADRHVEETIPASLSVALPILQGAADEDREQLVDLWAQLLANAMDPNLNNVRHLFVEAVKKMDPPDALVLKIMYKGHNTNVEHNIAQPGGATIFDVYNETGCGHIDSVEASVNHLETIGFLHDRSMTATCREFLRACYPEVGG
jgi:hypothetical protein